MVGLFGGVLRGEPRSGVYRGPDRRDLIARTAQPVDTWWVSAAALSVVVAPLLAAAFMTGSVLGLRAWEAGIGDAALLAYGAAALLLGMRWRFVGDAMCIPLATVAAVVALGYVPPTIHEGVNSAPIIGLRISSGIVLGVLVVMALRIEEVRSDLRPVRFITMALLVTGLLSVPFSVWPLRTVLQSSMSGVRTWGIVEAVLEIGVGLAVLSAGLQRRRRLLLATAGVLFAVAAASMLRAVHPQGLWLDVAALCLLVGAIGLVVTVAGEFQTAITAVVHHDVRGTRRWEATQTELDGILTSLQGQRHDVRNILTGIDGILMVLTAERRCMPEVEIDRTISSVRQEVQWLHVVMGDGAQECSYDVSELLSALIDIRACGRHTILADIAPDLVAQGRPDRLAIAVDNLLVNVKVHAPAARTVLSAHQLGDTVEIVVSDDGPGLLPDELHLACRRGWRSDRSASLPGTGFGLAQVEDLVTAEGGAMFLEPTCWTSHSAPRGLTVRLQVPIRQTNCSVPD